MPAIARSFDDRMTVAAVLQDLCDAGFLLEDIDVERGPGATRVTVRTDVARAGRAGAVMDRHARGGAQPSASPPDDGERGPTTDDVRRERDAAQEDAHGGESSAARFGAEMATNPRYGDADWTIVEPEARRQWHERGSGPWEAVRDEVRSAWERARGPRAA